MAEVEGLEPTRRLTAHSFPSCCHTIRRYFHFKKIITNYYTKLIYKSQWICLAYFLYFCVGV